MANVKANEVNEEMKEFTVTEVKELTSKDGRKFDVYKVLAKGGKRMDMRFTRDFEGNKPTERCIIVVPKESSSVDTRGIYPVLWVKKIVEIKPIPPKQSNVDEFFD